MDLFIIVTNRGIQFSIMFSFLLLNSILVNLRLLKPEYAEAFPVYRIHVIGTFFMYNVALGAGHYTLINRGSILTYFQIFSVIVNIVMNAVGIKLLGFYGAALATVITQGLSLFVLNLLFGKEGREVLLWQVKALNPISMFKK